MRPSINEWHVFTRIWVENVRHLKHNPHHCRLAVAMAASDNHRHPWDHYLSLAVECKAFHEEMSNPVLQRRKAFYEALGWTITFDGHGWRVEAQSLKISAKRLADALRQIEEWGQPYLAVQAIQTDVNAILEGAQ